MSTMIISYDLGMPEASESYSRLCNAIKGLGDHTKPLESFWIVDSYKTCSEVRDILKNYLDENDKLFVARVPLDGWATYNIPPNSTDWMRRK